MNTVKEIGISICVTAMATTLFHYLVPKSPLDKTIRFVLSVFFISCLIVPILKIDFSSLTDAENVFQTTGTPQKQNRFEEKVNEKLLSLTEQTVALTTKELFRNEGISDVVIDVTASVSESGGIDVDEILIRVNREDKEEAQALIETLSENPGEAIIRLETDEQ